MLTQTCLVRPTTAQVSPTPSDQQPPCGIVFRLSAGQKTNQPASAARSTLPSFVQGLEVFLTSALHICQQTKCIMPSHMYGGKHGAHTRGKHGLSCHATAGRWTDATSRCVAVGSIDGEVERQ